MFNEMKKAIKEESEDILNYQFGYNGPYIDYVNGVYGDAVDELSKQVGEQITIEPSIQCGCGRNDMYCDSGTANWDFESECETLLEFAEEAETEQEFKDKIVSYLYSKWEDCGLEDDSEDE